jgi:hypothetical protein
MEGRDGYASVPGGSQSDAEHCFVTSDLIGVDQDDSIFEPGREPGCIFIHSSRIAFAIFGESQVKNLL